LRGAVSLALALAVTEHPWLPEETRRFVAVLATGYVLITVFVNGTTLRPLIHLLGLDQLTPADQELRDRTLALSLETVRERTGDIALDHGFTAETAKVVAAPYAERLRALERAGARQEVSETERLTIGLLTLASHEERLYLRYRRERLISSRILERLIAAAGWLHDGAKAGGIEGYEAAWRRQLGFSRRFRLALFLHRRLGIATPLAAILSDRFETLTIIRMALKVLVNFADRRLPPLLGVSVAARLGSLMGERLVAVESALDALRLQYPAYAGALQQRYLMRAALRLEEAGYRELLSESVIGQEVYNDLSRGLAQRWRDADRRPPLDLGLSTDQLIAGVPMFAEIGPEPRAAIARLLRPRLAVPGDRIVSRGERGEAMYFISSGAVEVSIPGTPARLGSGDFFGELALITNQPRVADVTALGYCQLLVLLARDFRRLLDADSRLAERIGSVAKERLGTSIQPAK
jgi:CPA1 family monovalent cation:H+ antiporter